MTEEKDSQREGQKDAQAEQEIQAAPEANEEAEATNAEASKVEAPTADTPAEPVPVADVKEANTAQPQTLGAHVNPASVSSDATPAAQSNGGVPSLIVGILSVVAAFIISALIGLIFGIIAILLAKKDLDKYGTCPKAKVGMILGIIAIALSVVTWVISFASAAALL